MPQLPAYFSDSCAEVLDDFEMTFQILLIGTDGIVLGSDRLFRTRGLREMVQSHRPSYQPTLGTKIYISDNGETICAFAGGPYAETIARRIVTTCTPSGLPEPNWRNALETATRGVTDYSEQIADELLVIRVDNMSALKMIRQQRDDPSFTPVDGHIYSGVETDAILIPKLFWRVDMNCRELKTLAIASIIQASLEAPQLVGGGINIVSVGRDKRISECQYSQFEATEIRDGFIAKVRQSLS